MIRLKTANDVLKYLKSGHVEFVDFRFTDILGQLHHITYDSSFIDEDCLERGITFDGSSIKGWKEIHKSDMVIMPDLSTGFMDPFSTQKCLVLLCYVKDPATGDGYNRDPRTIAAKAERCLLECGIGDTVFFGPELEFFLFDDVRFAVAPNRSFYSVNSEECPQNNATKFEAGNMGYRPDYKGGYFPVPPVDSFHNLRSEIVNVLKDVNIETILHHHEVAASQGEVGFKHAGLLTSADNVQKFKYVVRNVAISYGKSATFMPKPVLGDNGSGMHVHQSIWKDGKTLFFGQDTRNHLSDMCLYYIGGIIKHAKAINAFTNPTTNSYKRLIPGFEAPTTLAYSAENRSAAIRIPYVQSSSATRIETRFPDPAANPYLGFAALLLAGLDGIRNKIHPGEPEDRNLYKDDSHGLPKVSNSLRGSLETLAQDNDFLKQGGAFDDDTIENYIKLKMQEVRQLEGVPNPLEFKLYYGC